MKKLCVLSRLNESRKVRRGVSWSLSLMGLFLTGCLFPEIKPCYGLEVGDELLIEIGEPARIPYDLEPWEPVTCPDYGVVPGATVTAQVEYLLGGHVCSAGVGDLYLQDGLQLELQKIPYNGDSFFEGKYNLHDKRTDCRGGLSVVGYLQLPAGEKLEPGKKIAGDMRFTFRGSGQDGCFPGCTGRFWTQVSLK